MRLQLFGVDSADLLKDEDVDLRDKEKPREKLKTTVSEDGLSAETTFPLTETLTGYRMIVVDEFGFVNQPQQYRSVRTMPEDPPQVFLLRDAFGFEGSGEAAFDVEGLPVVLGERIRIPYVCFGPYGLGKRNSFIASSKSRRAATNLPRRSRGSSWHSRKTRKRATSIRRPRYS